MRQFLRRNAALFRCVAMWFPSALWGCHFVLSQKVRAVAAQLRHAVSWLVVLPGSYAVCASAHGCSPCRAARGAPPPPPDVSLDGEPPTPFPLPICVAPGWPVAAEWLPGGAKPLLMASACRDIIRRLAACRSASRSSAVWRLENELFDENENVASREEYCRRVRVFIASKNTSLRTQHMVYSQPRCAVVTWSNLYERAPPSREYNLCND